VFAAEGHTFQGQGKGSVALANAIRDGLIAPDVFVASDSAVMADLLASHTAITWYATFATTRLVVAYSPKSPFVEELRAAASEKRAWTDVLALKGMRLVRTDPAIDPKGYRTILMTKLAERFYKKPGLREAILGDDRNMAQIQTDEGILVRLEGGDADAGVLYLTEAVSRKLPYIALPPQIDLGDPKYAKEYAGQSVAINGVVRQGAPIEYAFTIPIGAKNVAGGDAFLRLIESREGQRVLVGAGLVTHAARFYGDLEAVPKDLRI
jgi:molybdate/tungstate transport system substrate-binding protein